MFLPKLKEKRKAFFFIGKTYIYPINYVLYIGLMLTITKVFIILFLLVRVGNILAIFKINQYALLSVECLGICPSWPN